MDSLHILTHSQGLEAPCIKKPRRYRGLGSVLLTAPRPYQLRSPKKPMLKPMAKALATLARHTKAVARNWFLVLTNTRLDGMNGLLLKARSRARGYRGPVNFITITYLVGSPVGRPSFKSNPYKPKNNSVLLSSPSI